MISVLHHIAKATRCEQATYRFTLSGSVFEQQAARGRQVSGSAGRDFPDGVETVLAPDQGFAWLEAHSVALEMGIAARDIGWVCDDQRRTVPAERRAPVAAAKLDIAKPETNRVRCGECEGGGGNIGGDDPAFRTLPGERKGNRAAAGAQIGELKRARRGNEPESELDEALGLGPGNQDGGRHLEVQGPEPAPAQEVGDGYATGSHIDQAPVARLREGRHRITGVGVEPWPRPAEDMGEQKRRIPARVARRAGEAGPAPLPALFYPLNRSLPRARRVARPGASR